MRERKRERHRSNKRVNNQKKNKQKGASHCWDPSSHFPTSLLQVTQREMENRAPETVVYSVVNNHQVRNSEGDLTLRLSMQGSTLSFVIYTTCLLLLVCFSLFAPPPRTSFSPHLFAKGECVNCHWVVGYLHHLCHLVTAVWLSLAGSGWAPRPVESEMSLSVWYWGSEQTCCGANPSDGHSGDSESQWGTFPWPQATEIWNRDR